MLQLNFYKYPLERKGSIEKVERQNDNLKILFHFVHGHVEWVNLMDLQTLFYISIFRLWFPFAATYVMPKIIKYVDA